MSGDILQRLTPSIKRLARLPCFSDIIPSSLPLPSPTVTASQVPSLFREPYILSGYRPVRQDWRCYLLSLFQRHNESLNVWTHLLAGPVLLLRWWANAGALGYTLDAASLPLSLFLVSSLTYLFFSVAAHLLQSHSEHAHYFLFFLDYVGVAVYQYGCSLGFYCYTSEPAWRESSIGVLYLPGALFFGWLSCAACCFAKSRYRRPYPLQRKIFQLIPSTLAYLLVMSPVVHRLFTVPWTQEPSLPFHALQIASFLLCALFFSCPIPERFFPGHCDFVGQGHQIFHLFLSLSTVFQLEALFQDYARRRDTVGEVLWERQVWWACASFPALFLCCMLTVLVTMSHMKQQLDHPFVRGALQVDVSALRPSCRRRHWLTGQTHVGAYPTDQPPPLPPADWRAGERRDSRASDDPRLQLRRDGQDRGLRRPGRCDTVLSPFTVCSGTMAAMGPEDRAGAGPGGAAVCPSGLQARVSTTTHDSNRPDGQQILVYTQSCVQAEKAFVESRHHKSKTPVHLPQREAERGWSNQAAPLQTMGPTMHHSHVSANGEAPYSFRSPESVEMDEIMAAMVLTSLSCSPVVQSPPRTDPGLGGSSSSADMECGGGELSDSGSSGYWSWDHGNVSPAPSPSVTEMDSSPDEGLHMELEQGEELSAKKPKSTFRGVYKCLWPSCGKVLTSSVGIKRHIRVLHLGSGSEQSQREEDFYFTKISCETVDASSAPAPSQQALGQAASSHLSWASCGSPPASGLQIPPAHRPRSNSSSGPGPSRPSPLSQSAPGSFWQIHSEHLYQACGPVQVPVASRSPGCQGWTPSASVSGHSSTPMVKPRCRSVSVGEQWLQQNRLQPMSVSPSRTHCSFRKGRGEAKKCRKVYGVERKDQWCTACRWKKACQRFPD